MKLVMLEPNDLALTLNKKEKGSLKFHQKNSINPYPSVK